VNAGATRTPVGKPLPRVRNLKSGQREDVASAGAGAMAAPARPAAEEEI